MDFLQRIWRWSQRVDFGAKPWIGGVLEQKAFGSLYLLLWKGFGEGEERNASNGITSHGKRQHLGVSSIERKKYCN